VLEAPPSKPKFIERLGDDYIVREPKPARPQIPMSDAPVAYGKFADKGHIPASVATMPHKNTETTFPFKTEI
jgi:hypothetical protein